MALVDCPAVGDRRRRQGHRLLPLHHLIDFYCKQLGSAPCNLLRRALERIRINSPANSREGEEVAVKNVLLPSPGRRATKEQPGASAGLVVDLNAGCSGMSLVLVGVFHCLWLHCNEAKQPWRSFPCPGEEVGCGDGEGGDVKQVAVVIHGHQTATMGAEGTHPGVERISILYGLFFFQRALFHTENKDAHPCDLFVI